MVLAGAEGLLKNWPRTVSFSSASGARRSVGIDGGQHDRVTTPTRGPSTVNEYPDPDEINNGPNPQSPSRSSRRAGVIGLLAVGGLAAGGAALHVANAAGAAPSGSSASGSSASGSSASGSSASSASTAASPTASGAATCTRPGPGLGGRPASRPAPGGPGRGPIGTGADGRITAVSSSSLTVRDLFGKSYRYKITSATVIHSGPARSVKVGALAVGEHVVVRTSSSTSTAADIDLHLARIDGSVSAVSSSAITLIDRDGFTRTIDTDSQTKYTLNAASSSRSKVTTGTVVRAEGKVDVDGTALDAANVDVVTAAKIPAASWPRPCAPQGGPGPGGRHHVGGPGAPKPSSSGGSQRTSHTNTFGHDHPVNSTPLAWDRLALDRDSSVVAGR